MGSCAFILFEMILFLKTGGLVTKKEDIFVIENHKLGKGMHASGNISSNGNILVKYLIDKETISLWTVASI